MNAEQETERQLLGSIFLKPSIIDDVMEIVKADDFANDLHNKIYSSMMKAKVIDVFAIGEELNQLAYCGQLAKDTLSAARARVYAEIVHNKALARQLSITMSDGLEKLKTEPVADVLESVEQSLNSISEGQASEYPDTGQMITDAFQDSVNVHDGGRLGIQTGIASIDRIIPGLEGGDDVIIAGRPSMGKTTLAVNIAENMPGRGIIFSMEMSGKQLIQRMMATDTGIHLQKIRTGNLNDSEWKRLMDSTVELRNKEIIVDDRGGLSPYQIRARLRAEKRRAGIDYAVIDYIQLMQMNTKENRTNEVSAISRMLKAIAKEIDIPIIILSQLSRNLESRPDKRPIMSDLRESGSLEQDADIIIFLYRDEVYNPDTPHKGLAEAIIRKQRNGPLGTAYMNFQSSITKFTDYVGRPPELTNVKPMKRYGDL